MENFEKKVILVIVEGPSDEAAIGSVFKEYFSNDIVQFQIVHGDITTQDYVTQGKIIEKINQIIDSVKSKYRYKNEDFLKIIHLVDTDGVYIPDEYVHEAKVDEFVYYVDHMDVKSKSYAVQRNHNKAKILSKLYSTNQIAKIPYKTYFNSCNLEHVLYNELKNFTDEEKRDMADEFAEKYEGDVEGFISFISSIDVAVPGNYRAGWKFIEDGLNSLKRWSNMHLIFAENQ